MSLLRLPFILSEIVFLQAATVRPNPSPEEHEKVPPKGLETIFAKIVPWYAAVLNTFYAIFVIIEVVVILAGVTPSSTLSSQVLSILVQSDQPAVAASRIRVTPYFVISWFLAVSGCLIRLSCYRHLGRLFTHELTIRKHHRLITSGPYSVVRHPSYTGVMMRELGFSCCHLYTSGSWVQECSDLSLGRTITQLLMFLWVAREVFVISLFIVRVKKEDEMLGREFKDWDKWARKVPYKFIPYVY